MIASGVSNFEWTVTIGAGSDNGIALNMPVVTGASDGPRLVGRVIQVTPISSMVQLLIDRDFAVPATLSTSHEAGIVEGRGEDELRMRHGAARRRGQRDRAGVRVHPRLPVEGEAGLYPPGILIGTVSRAFSEAGSVESFVTIRPAVDFSTLQNVLVIARRRAAAEGAP